MTLRPSTNTLTAVFNYPYRKKFDRLRSEVDQLLCFAVAYLCDKSKMHFIHNEKELLCLTVAKSRERNQILIITTKLA